MSKILATTYFIKEEETDGHNPMKFECSDGNIYYCKYRTSVKQDEIDCLAYEIVATQLLKSLNIATPDIALVQISTNSVAKKDLKYNKRAWPDAVCFGSKKVPASSLANGTQLFASKKEVKRYINYTDIIKIATFDLMVDNRDRGRDDNINLLEAEISVGNKKMLKFYAIDHAFIFGGQQELRFFKPTENLNYGSKLIENEYFKSCVRFIPKKIRLQVLEEFVNSYNEVYDESLQKAFALFHNSWKIPTNLNDRMFDFLSSKERLNRVSIKMNESLKLL